MYYFNDKLIHNNIKHVTIEALSPGEGAAYSVKFEFDRPVRLSREFEQSNAVQTYLRKNRQKTLALSRALACKPNRSAEVLPYPHFPRAYKVIDYGNVDTSFYGLVVVVN